MRCNGQLGLLLGLHSCLFSSPRAALARFRRLELTRRCFTLQAKTQARLGQKVWARCVHRPTGAQHSRFACAWLPRGVTLRRGAASTFTTRPCAAATSFRLLGDALLTSSAQLLFLSVCILVSVPADAQTFTCGASDNLLFCDVLSDFYYATNGQGWTTSSGWASAAAGTATDYCSFYGVFCRQGGIPWVLQIEANNLTGTLPSSLGNMSSLIELNLPFNNITGTIPSELSNLQIYDLDLNSNSFSGTIPTLPTNLYEFNVNSNLLTGTIPATLNSVTRLSWLCVRLQAPCTQPLTRRTLRLSRSILSNNQLTGTIPSSLSVLPGWQLCVCAQAAHLQKI